MRLENGLWKTTFLDTGVEINVITQQVMKDSGLAIRRGPKLELLSSHTGHSRLFLGFCEDVEVAIEREKKRHRIFIIKYKDYDLILGQLF